MAVRLNELLPPTDNEAFARLTEMRPVDPAEPRNPWLVTFEVKARGLKSEITVPASGTATIQDAWEELDATVSAMLEAVRAAKPTG